MDIYYLSLYFKRIGHYFLNPSNCSLVVDRIHLDYHHSIENQKIQATIIAVSLRIYLNHGKFISIG